MKNIDMAEFERVLKELMSACAMMGYSRSGQETANHKATRDKLREELLSLLAERQSQSVCGGGVSEEAEDLSKLRQFAKELLGDFPEIGGWDGFDLQDVAEKCGLLRPEERNEPCGDSCQCNSEVGEFPITCYRFTETLKRSIDAALGARK